MAQSLEVLDAAGERDSPYVAHRRVPTAALVVVDELELVAPRDRAPACTCCRGRWRRAGRRVAGRRRGWCRRSRCRRLGPSWSWCCMVASSVGSCWSGETVGLALGFKVKPLTLNPVQGLPWRHADLRARRSGGCAGLDGPLLRADRSRGRARAHRLRLPRLRRGLGHPAAVRDSRPAVWGSAASRSPSCSRSGVAPTARPPTSGSATSSTRSRRRSPLASRSSPRSRASSTTFARSLEASSPPDACRTDLTCCVPNGPVQLDLEVRPALRPNRPHA